MKNRSLQELRMNQNSIASEGATSMAGVLQCVAVCCSVLQCAAVCCSMLQCVAVCCSVLQCVAVCSSVLQCDAIRDLGLSQVIV